MLFSGGACSRRVSLFKAVLFSAKMRKAREREKELGGGRERENFVFVVLFCFVWNAAGGRRRQKRLKVFLGNEEKERILMSEMFFKFFLFSFFFSRDPNDERYSRRQPFTDKVPSSARPISVFSGREASFCKASRLYSIELSLFRLCSLMLFSMSD